MKGTDHFKKTINDHLLQLAANDSLFAETLKKPNKNIDGCVTYIFNEVKKSGCNGFADAEIFGMAVHYYDEDDIKPGKKINATVVVNHSVKRKPKSKVAEPVTELSKFEQKPKVEKQPKVIKMVAANQVSLFDF